MTAHFLTRLGNQIAPAVQDLRDLVTAPGGWIFPVLALFLFFVGCWLVADAIGPDDRLLERVAADVKAIESPAPATEAMVAA